jgi:hypothetical protein
MSELLKREKMARALFEVGAPPHQFWDDVGLDKRELYLCMADAALSQGSSHLAPGALPSNVMPQDWSCLADLLDGIEADANGMCKWTDVANAQVNLRATLRCAQADHPVATLQSPPPLNSGERLPSSDAANGGGDTHSAATSAAPAGYPPGVPKDWTSDMAARASWIVFTLANTPPDEWERKAVIYETMAVFRTPADPRNHRGSEAR